MHFPPERKKYVDGFINVMINIMAPDNQVCMNKSCTVNTKSNTNFIILLYNLYTYISIHVDWIKKLLYIPS